MENCLDAHFICFMTRYTVCVQQNTRVMCNARRRYLTLHNKATLNFKQPGAESDTHASFESGFRNNSIVQNNNYSFFFFL